MVLNFGEKIAEGLPQTVIRDSRGQARLHGDRGMTRRSCRPMGWSPATAISRRSTASISKLRAGRGRRADRRQRRGQIDLAADRSWACCRVAPDMVRLDGAAGRRVADRIAWLRRAWRSCPKGGGSSPACRSRTICASPSTRRRRPAPRAAGRWTGCIELFPILKEKARTPVQSALRRPAADGRHRPGAALNQPRVLLCDEISLGLAPKVVQEIYAVDPRYPPPARHRVSGRAGCRPRPVRVQPALLHAGGPRDAYRQIGRRHPRSDRRSLFRRRSCSGLTGWCRAILLGGMYAQYALGMALMFGVMRIVNITHGDLMILLALIGISLAATFGLGPWSVLVDPGAARRSSSAGCCRRLILNKRGRQPIRCPR